MTAQQAEKPKYNYYDNVNYDLLKHIPANLGFVLEVGCAAGALGEKYKAANPGSHFIGIEMIQEAAEIAQQRLDAVVVKPVEKVELKDLKMGKKKFDCIIYGDVLEHLNNPWEILERHKKWLAADGVILACIPNTQHWTLLYSLLRGKWEYTEMGLLDRTHIRFFTCFEIIRMFENADFKVEFVAGRNLSIKSRLNPDLNHEGFLNAMAPSLQALGMDDKSFARLTGSYQFIIKAKSL